MNHSDDWINDEQKLFERKKYFRSIKPSVTVLPQHLQAMQFLCSNGHAFKLDLLAPLLPVRSTVSELLWVPTGFHDKCPVCGVDTEIPLPKTKKRTGIALAYGDEALRRYDGKVIVTYSFAISPSGESKREKLKEQYFSLKRRLLPAIDPSRWTAHMLVLFSQGERQRSATFSGLSTDDAVNFLKEVGNLVSTTEISIFNSAATFASPTTYNKKFEKAAKKRVFEHLYFNLIYSAGIVGAAPKLVMEKSGQDGWIKSLDNGARLTLMWPYLANGLAIPKVDFRPPAFHWMLEIADCFSFVVARYLYQTAELEKGTRTSRDVDPGWFGEVFYMGFKSEDTATGLTSAKYPLGVFASAPLHDAEA
ncbi:MAG: hypothetical protein ACI9SK_001651 [Zhongshania sp.]|jgi:hypothetical protein